MRAAIILIGLGLALGAVPMAGPVQAQTNDHLKCYKIKGDLKLKGLLDLTTPQFGLEPGCKISKAKLFCVPATKSNVDVLDGSTKEPITPLPFSASPAPGDRVCWKVKCPEPFPSDQVVTDQFGTQTLTKFKTKLLCTPAVKGTEFCGDGLISGGEVCEPTDDSACPGLCQPDCTCEVSAPTCSDCIDPLFPHPCNGMCWNCGAGADLCCPSSGNPTVCCGSGFICEPSIGDCIFLPPLCGNGVIDGELEQCDDGNTQSGDCCSSRCQFESGPCNDQSNCTEFDTCSGGQCVGVGNPASCSFGDACIGGKCSGTCLATDVCELICVPIQDPLNPFEFFCDIGCGCAPSPPCNESSGPSCGGSCPAGSSCGSPLFFPEICLCFPDS